MILVDASQFYFLELEIYKSLVGTLCGRTFTICMQLHSIFSVVFFHISRFLFYLKKMFFFMRMVFYACSLVRANMFGSILSYLIGLTCQEIMT